MPAIPEPTRDSITWRLILHAEQNWPQLDKVQVTCRGGFAYATGVLTAVRLIGFCSVWPAGPAMTRFLARS